MSKFEFLVVSETPEKLGQNPDFRLVCQSQHKTNSCYNATVAFESN